MARDKCAVRGSRGKASVRAWPVALVATAFLGGCGNSSSDSKPSTKVPDGVLPELAEKAVPTPAGGLTFYTPVIKQIPPGADVTYCTFTDQYASEDLFITTTRGAQSSFGHHGILFYATTPQPENTVLCSGRGMEQMRQLIGGTGGEGTGVWEPPENVGTVVPKGSQFIVQTHWINTGSTPKDVQAMMVTVPGRDGPDRVNTGTVAIVDVSFNVPANGRGSGGTECEFQQDHKMLMSIGHEHEWGTHVRADLIRAAGGEELLFDRPFSPHDVFDPPVNAYPVADPLLIMKGDRIKMSCDWQNTTTEALNFPGEMCVFFGYSMEEGDARCINGNWMGSGGGGDGGTAIPGPPCAAVGAPGNELGIGKYCTAGGGECAAGAASICLADYTTGEFGNFCTMLCQDDSACGTGTVCVGSSPSSSQKACIPAGCVGDGGTL